MREFTATVTRKGQMTIPVEMRRRIGLSTPAKVTIFMNDRGNLELQPARKPTILDLGGSLPSLGRETGDFGEIIKEAMDEAADRLMSLK